MRWELLTPLTATPSAWKRDAVTADSPHDDLGFDAEIANGEHRPKVGYAFLREQLPRSLQAVHQRHHGQHRALMLPYGLNRLHRRAAASDHIIYDNNARPRLEAALDQFLRAVSFDAVADPKAFERLSVQIVSN